MCRSRRSSAARASSSRPDRWQSQRDFNEEAHAVLRNVGACLAAAGCSYADVLSVNVYIVDLADFDAFNEIYRSYFEAPFPARTDRAG